jgi:hypothetical protein
LIFLVINIILTLILSISLPFPFNVIFLAIVLVTVIFLYSPTIYLWLGVFGLVIPIVVLLCVGLVERSRAKRRR